MLRESLPQLEAVDVDDVMRGCTGSGLYCLTPDLDARAPGLREIDLLFQHNSAFFHYPFIPFLCQCNCHRPRLDKTDDGIMCKKN